MRLIYFAPVYARSYAQRPHFTVEHWLELGVEQVLWVDPYPVRLPQWQDLHRGRGIYNQATPLDPQINVLHVPALPIEPLPCGTWLNRRLLWRTAWQQLVDFTLGASVILGIGRPSALALLALRSLRCSAAFYEAMDNFPEFHQGLARRAMRRHEDLIAAEVDLVVASSTFLAEKFTRRGLRVMKMLNACTPESLPIRNHAASQQPVLGFVGCLGKWIDWPLLTRLAEQMPETRIELVGPCAASPPNPLPANIHLLPPCKQHEVGMHLKRFSAGLIPFRRTALTTGMDPIKFYEYRAVGLPVLSTQFGEMALRGPGDGVYFLDQGDDMKSVVANALSQSVDLAAIEQFRRANDWRHRFRGADPFRCLLPAQALRPAA
jgi:hypothetical protein